MFTFPGGLNHQLLSKSPPSAIARYDITFLCPTTSLFGVWPHPPGEERLILYIQQRLTTSEDSSHIYLTS